MNQHRNRALGRVLKSIVVFGVLVAAFVSVTVMPAAASDCSWIGCGEAENYSRHSAYIAELAVPGGSHCQVRYPQPIGVSYDCAVKTLPSGKAAGGGNGYFDDVDAIAFPTTGFYTPMFNGISTNDEYVWPGQYLKFADYVTVICRDFVHQPSGWVGPHCKVW